MPPKLRRQENNSHEKSKWKKSHKPQKNNIRCDPHSHNHAGTDDDESQVYHALDKDLAGCHSRSRRSGDGRVGWDSLAAQPPAWPAARAGCWRTRSSGLSRDVRSANNMNAALHAALRRQHFRQPRKQPRQSTLRLTGRPGLCAVESFNRVLLSERSLVFSHPTVHTQQSTVPPGVAEHNVTVARAFTKLMGAFVTFWDNDAGSKIHLLANPGQDVARIGAARQEDSLLESQTQQYPHNPMKGASEHFHFLSVLAGTYDDTVRNIDIDCAGYLRHSFIAGFPTERVPKMPLSGVSTRSGDLARFTFKGRVHSPDSLSAGDALWHRSLRA